MTVASDAFRRDLGFNLGVVLRAYTRAANVVVEEIPGGARGFQVLAAATHETVRGQGGLAEQLGVDRSVMVYLLDDLEAAGLVERRPDPADRRNRRIVATAKGRRVCASIEKRLCSAEDHVLYGLSDEEQETFRTLLYRMASRANEADPAEDACDVVADLASSASRRGRGRRA